MRKITHSIASLFAMSLLFCSTASATDVTIHKNEFYIDGKPTYQGRYWNGHKVAGLLMNSRMVQGVFDNLNPDTRDLFKYPDTGVWDANRNTAEFVDAMEEWYKHGVLAFTLNLQGGSPTGYGKLNCLNSAFDSDGKFRDDYKGRLKLILDRADKLGMVVILGYFYFGFDQYLTDEKAVVRAVDEATQWILDNKYKNVMIEIANECNIHYDHEILQPKGISQLIERVKSIKKSGRRLLVGASFSGGAVPTSNVLASSDFVLIHGNGVKEPEKMRTFIQKVRATDGYTQKPIIVNEDDHFDFDKPESNLTVSVEEYASWGYFDYRKKDEPFETGYQSVPVSWGITTPRKRDFFDKVKEITAFVPSHHFAHNPILPNYHADPSAHYWDGKYWIYPSTDERGSTTWDQMKRWECFSSKNLVDWKNEGEIFSLDKISWATNSAFAPDAMKWNGKYYFFFPAENMIGVAVSDKPNGPFKDALGKPLIGKNECKGVASFDPCIFIDDDKTPYLYYGGWNGAAVVKLKENLIEKAGPITKLPLKGYGEGIWVFKRNGLYYFTYPTHIRDTQGNIKQLLVYSTSKTPTGPFEYKGMFLDNKSRNSHHSIIKIKGKWYLFYHVQGPSPYERQVCLDYLHFDKDGNIMEVKMTKEGVKSIK